MKQAAVIMFTMCLCLNGIGMTCIADGKNSNRSMFQVKLKTYQEQQKAFQDLFYVFRRQLIKCCKDPEASEEFKILNDIMKDVEREEEYLHNEK